MIYVFSLSKTRSILKKAFFFTDFHFKERLIERSYLKIFKLQKKETVNKFYFSLFHQVWKNENSFENIELIFLFFLHK